MKRCACLLLILPVLVVAEPVEYFSASIPKKYYNELVGQCTTFGVPIIYAARLIEWESRWDEKCVTTNSNGTKDKGLMKLNSAYMNEFAFRYNNGIKIDPFNWKQSMKVGVHHLSTLRKATGSWFGAVAAYNMGYTAYKEWRKGKRGMPEATKKELEYVFQ